MRKVGDRKIIRGNNVKALEKLQNLIAESKTMGLRGTG